MEVERIELEDGGHIIRERSSIIGDVYPTIKEQVIGEIFDCVLHSPFTLGAANTDLYTHLVINREFNKNGQHVKTWWYYE